MVPIILPQPVRPGVAATHQLRLRLSFLSDPAAVERAFDALTDQHAFVGLYPAGGAGAFLAYYEREAVPDDARRPAGLYVVESGVNAGGR